MIEGGRKPDWHILYRISGDIFILARNKASNVRYIPLYIHSFLLCAPSRLLQAQLFSRKYQCYADIDNVPDRLRWCRYSKGLKQKEVAEIAGLPCTTYLNIECGAVQHIPIQMVERLAAYYEVPEADFMDEFNRFLYDGQASRIYAYRESTGLGKKAFARLTGIPLQSLRAWESGQKQISRQSWEKYFKGKLF